MTQSKKRAHKAQFPLRESKLHTVPGVRACQHCGTVLTQITRGRPRSFCSDACRQRSFREKTTDPHVLIPRALLDALGQFLRRVGGSEARALSRALLEHDVRRARKLARAALAEQAG
jgi:hypothetical protein